VYVGTSSHSTVISCGPETSGASESSPDAVSVTVTSTSLSQLSVAVTVAAVNVSLQDAFESAGTPTKTGAVVSLKFCVYVSVAVFPHASVAENV